MNGPKPVWKLATRKLSQSRPRKRRVVAAFLWFYAGWYIGAAIAYFLGLPDAFGVIMGTAAAALMAGDPRRLIWRIRTSSASSGPARA